jgi:hypothetical protein
MACHGGTRPNERREYTTWIERDRHAQAFLVLYGQNALRIAENLGIERPDQDARCVNCHSSGWDAPRGPKFALEDGVSCEVCHGPAERWLVPHSKPDWKTRLAQDKSETFGLTNTKDLIVRAQVCVGCHLGEPGREVNHDLIAAGHPQLVFELDAYTANMPPHWPEPADPVSALGAKAWAAGQIVSLRQSLELLAHRARRADWPEFAEYECRACHHALNENSWRLQIGFGDRRAGTPLWSNPHVLVSTRPTASVGEFSALRKLLQEPGTPAGDIAVAADKAARSAELVARQAVIEGWDQNRLRGMLAALAADRPAESLDYSTAAYTTMALGAVFESLARLKLHARTADEPWTTRGRQTLDQLYDDVQEPSSYNAAKFVSDLKTFREAVP